mgnify:CR=1 FL=1
MKISFLHKAKAKLITLAFFASNSALALETNINGESIVVENNDIFALLMTILGYGVAFIFGCISVYALFQTLNTTWQKWGEYHVGKAEMKELIMPLGVGGLLTIFTFAISAYTVTNFTNFFG